MSIDVSIEQHLLVKLGQLSRDKLIAVEEFIDRLDQEDKVCDRSLSIAECRLQTLRHFCYYRL